MPKTIIFCADGTWNHPLVDEDGDGVPDPTNVYKLFMLLEGSLAHGSVRSADEQEIELRDATGKLTQIAKYIHGVGDPRNRIRNLIGGAFGAGVIERIVRGYTFISRNYQPGDRIVLVGFSRGAYTARALAGMIASQGLLPPDAGGGIPTDRQKEDAYRRGAQVWHRYRETAAVDKASFGAKLAEMVALLPAFLSTSKPDFGQLVQVESIHAVGVWDTVGAMGLPKHDDGPSEDVFKFADTTLSPKVKFGFHAVARDEQRVCFEPTLWHPVDERIDQVVFPGAHADVGGGYPSVGFESDLSDGALHWMWDRLRAVGVKFVATPPYDPDVYPTRGVAHMPWNDAPWSLPSVARAPRTCLGGMPVHPSVSIRLGKNVRHDAKDPKLSQYT